MRYEQKTWRGWRGAWRVGSAAATMAAVVFLLTPVATAQTVTPIATIQASPSSFDGQVVTVEGQVYVPNNYRGTLNSGYIQDSSGRGINIFGTTPNNALLTDIGNIVRVTGTVDVFITTVEITSVTAVTLVSGGNPPLQPQVLSTNAANSSAWEGTFIQVSGDISAVARTTTSTPPATNYTVNDGSGATVVRVVDTATPGSFSVGQTITARGAGSQFQSTFQLLVGRGADVFESGGGGDTTPPTLASATATSATQVAVGFSEQVTAATAELVGNYAVFVTATPATTIPVTSVALSPGSGQVATLSLGASLQNGVGYTVRVSNVQDVAGNTITPNSTRTFTYSSVQTTPIATIQANPSSFDGTVVTVEGQVYIPANYRGGTVYSGYIQDSSNRGINLFGSAANNALLNDVGNIVRVTGTVDVFFSTVEITSLTNVTLVSSGNPALQPEQLGTGAAASTAWEGTFIEATGTITAATPSGPGTNYTIDDGSGNLDVRVVDNLGAASFAVGQTITARGAGAQFQSTFQILVGRPADVFESGGGGDTTPPTLAAVTASTATEVTVRFSERVTAATAQVTANYALFETATPANGVPVTGATLSGNAQSVTLTLGASLQNGVGYTVRVNNVQDEAGNTIVANSTRTFTYSSVQTTPIATIQASPSSFDGQVVTVEGQVYVPNNYRGTLNSGYIQDSSERGINIFGTTPNNALLTDIGNIVRLTGTVDVFNTTVEITSVTAVTLVSGGNPLLQPQVLRTNAANSSAWEGTFIEVTGTITNVGRTETSTPPATNYTVNDGSGSTVVRVVDTATPGSFSVGQTITARGAGSQFQSTFQMLVGRAEDVFVAATPGGQANLSLSGPPYTFVPTVGETYPIAVTVPPARQGTSEVLLRVFDLQGRLRRTLVDSRFDPVLPKVAWNGRDDASELVPAGTYIVHLLVTDTKSGGREALQMPVVVATRLNR